MADVCFPVNSDTFSRVEKPATCALAPSVWVRPSTDSDFPEKLSAGLDGLTQHPRVLRESKSSGYLRITALRQERPLCTKVWHHSLMLHFHLNSGYKYCITVQVPDVFFKWKKRCLILFFHLLLLLIDLFSFTFQILMSSLKTHIIYKSHGHRIDTESSSCKRKVSILCTSANMEPS